MSTRIDLKVPDLAAFTQYFKSLGFVEVHRTAPHEGNIELALPRENWVIRNRRKAGITATGIDHIAFGVDDLDDQVAALKNKGASENKGRA